jgi:DNA-binding IclR family transcriptional regulator
MFSTLLQITRCFQHYYFCGATEVENTSPKNCRKLLIFLISVISKRSRFYYSSRQLTPQTVTDVAKLRDIVAHVRLARYAMPEHEVYEGRRSLAVPICNREGKTVAAINISAMNSRASRDKFLNEYLPILQVAAEQIGASV